MSRAEERALEVYPKMSRISEPHGVIPADYESHYLGDANAEKREGFIEGYHQAEKDLELTWEDIEKITDIWDDLHEDEAVYSKTGYDTPEFYQEILKRFKDFKEGKEK